MINLSFAEEPCLTLNKTDLKVEAWLSKKYEKKYINSINLGKSNYY